MSAPPEPAWKRWLDRLLMVNVLLVFIGAGVFAVAVVQQLSLIHISEPTRRS